MEDFLSTQWESTSIRHAFIRKVRLPIVCVFPAQSANDCEYHLQPLKSVFFFSLLCLWAGLLNFSCAACRHLFSCCRLYICVSSSFQSNISSRRLVYPIKGETPSTPEVIPCVCAFIVTQWGCLSSDTLASTGHRCESHSRNNSIFVLQLD